jgi:hypothetical protein
LWSLNFIATRSGILARTMLRMAVAGSRVECCPGAAARGVVDDVVHDMIATASSTGPSVQPSTDACAPISPSLRWCQPSVRLTAVRRGLFEIHRPAHPGFLGRRIQPRRGGGLRRNCADGDAFAQRAAERNVLRLGVLRQLRRVGREKRKWHIVVFAVLREAEMDTTDKMPRRTLT